MLKTHHKITANANVKYSEDVKRGKKTKIIRNAHNIKIKEERPSKRRPELRKLLLPLLLLLGEEDATNGNNGFDCHFLQLSQMQFCPLSPRQSSVSQSVSHSASQAIPSQLKPRQAEPSQQHHATFSKAKQIRPNTLRSVCIFRLLFHCCRY